jgi:hypothetical protein
LPKLPPETHIPAAFPHAKSCNYAINFNFSRFSHFFDFRGAQYGIAAFRLAI